MLIAILAGAVPALWLLMHSRPPIVDAKSWFVEMNGRKVGPVGYLDLISYLLEGRISRSTPVSSEGPDASWQPFGDPSERVAICGLSFVCRQPWKALESTAAPSKRRCTQCGQDVYLCSTVDDLKRRAAEGRCAAFHQEMGEPSGLIDDLSSLFQHPSDDAGGTRST